MKIGSPPHNVDTTNREYTTWLLLVASDPVNKTVGMNLVYNPLLALSFER